MSKIKEDTLAFACASENGHQKGLTIRQHFAAMAMQGLLSNPNYGIHEEGAFDCVSQDATRIADALINELNKNQTT